MTPCVRLACLMICIVLVTSADAKAQSPSSASQQPSRVQIGIGGLVSTAVNEFGTNVDRLGGVLSHFSVHLGGALSLGAEGSLSYYGTENRDLSVTTLAGASYVVVDHYMMSTHARLGVQPRSGRWRPHAEALVGIRWIATDTTVSEEVDSEDVGILDYAITSSDLGLSYGVGAGVTMGRSASSRWRVDVAVRYLSGSVANYLTKGAILGPFRQETLDLSRSRTDTVSVYVGVEWDTRGAPKNPPRASRR